METVKEEYKFEPDYAIPPGETLREVMESLGMNKKELSKRSGLSEESINRIFQGNQAITKETANCLEQATGVPASMWNNLEAQYRVQLVKIREKTLLESEPIWIKEIQVPEMI